MVQAEKLPLLQNEFLRIVGKKRSRRGNMQPMQILRRGIMHRKNRAQFTFLCRDVRETHESGMRSVRRKKEKATMKTYTLKPGDTVEAVTCQGGSALLRVECFEPSLLLVRVSSPADPCVSFLVSPYNITKVLPHG